SVADMAEMTMPTTAIAASRGDASPITATKGLNTISTLRITASVLARMTKLGGMGAVATRSGASPPEIADQARAPGRGPAAHTSTGTSSITSLEFAPKARHSIKPGGTR